MKYLIFNGESCFDIIVTADSEKEALRKFARYVGDNVSQFDIEKKIKYPTWKDKINGSRPYALELRDNLDFYYEDIKLGTYEVNKKTKEIS